MRLLIREGQPAAHPQAVLKRATGDTRHEFWPTMPGTRTFPFQRIISHHQITDAQLARARGSRLATFDHAMAKLHNDVADLIPDSLTAEVLSGDGES